MKQLKDFEQELNKCSKCGLCQDVCPIFKLNKNDCAVSKGKFTMLHGVTKGDLTLSKNINKYLDMCLKCGKCTAFCPAGIDACEIINTAKIEFMNKSYTTSILQFIHKIFMLFVKFCANITKPLRPTLKKAENPKMVLLYFKGCVNNVLPNTDKYLNKIFKGLPVDIVEPEFDCCGLPFLSDGCIESFEKVAKSNISKFDCKYDYLVTDCASCESTILDYPKYVKDFELLPSKSINWGNLIAFLDIKFVFKKNMKITFHKPCHLKNDVFLNKILKNCTNIEYFKMQDYDECCGFAGSFILKNNKISKELMKNKAKSVINSGADYVITSCPACIMGLNYGLNMMNNRKVKVLSLLELLAMADEIKY
ncbi:(Fe-S)-binding protein [bacterium]|nr:(Fe-S)-binding protein [bacterium]